MTTPQRLEQAADWFDRIDELSEQDKLRFAQWLTDASNQSAFNRVAAALGHPEVATAAIRINNNASQQKTVSSVPDNRAVSLQSVAPQSASPRRKTLYSVYGLASAAAIALVAVLVSVNVSNNSAPPEIARQPASSTLSVIQQAEFSTRAGEQHTARLNDGSMVILNGKSALAVNHSAQFREVSLTSGQAYFDVAHEPQRPFLVKLDNASVQVVGTAFDIDRLQDKTAIRVYDGVVKVTADTTLTLTKGDGVILQAGKWLQSFQLENSQLPDWRTGWLDISNEPINDIVQRLNRYTSKPVKLAGFSQLPVSGRFNVKAPEQALQLLANMDALTLTEHSDHFLLTVSQ
ncbi:FecR family protein [Alteromonas gilva]|uniref:FecR domain-containing protein n=1 Tax=Alteromonas gilva TaxID=2987522 RepID=A0ABT5L338_9ALTE|nr:FecR domain-containing protein [Alteromonas gilva]MDC8830811.1 FecR domain-containing protein [Alteromonas gilva]